MERQVVGRDGALAQIEGFLGALAEATPASLVIEGEAGIGKSTLWQVGVDEARARGYRVLVCRPAESETALSFAGLADLLEGVEDGRFEGLPGPQRRALEVALLRAEPVGRPLEGRAVFTAFGGTLRALSTSSPVLIAVDDAQWLDTSSLRALEFVMRRLADESVGLLCSLRTGERGGPVEFAVGEVLRLGGLSPAAIHQLIRAQTQLSLARPVVLRVHEATGGNPFFALELARALGEAGLPSASQSWPVPDDLRELTSARVGRLPASVRSLLLRAAARAEPTISGLSAAGLRTATRAGIVVTAGDGHSRFTHPLFASAIYTSATEDARRRIHGALAAETDEVEEHARHRALASDGPDEEVAGLLDRAATKARARGAPHVAAELQERAILLTPPDCPDRAWTRGATAAEYHFRAGDLRRARDLLVELVAHPVRGVSEGQARRLLGEAHYHLGDLDVALDQLRRAAEMSASDPAAAARAELDIAFVLHYSFGSFDDAAASIKRALAIAERLGDDALLSSALAYSSVSDFILGRGLDEEKLARALALENIDEPAPVERRPTMLAAWGLMYADQFERARSLFDGLQTRLIERGDETDLPDLLSMRAMLEWRTGNLDDACLLADESYRIARQAGSDSLAAVARAMRALADATAGRIAETRTAVAEARELAARSGWQSAAFWAAMALGLLELALGDDEAVVATLAGSIALVERVGLAEPARAPYLPDAIEALVQLGQFDRAAALAALLFERARALGRRSAIMTGARSTALVLAARGEVREALAVLDPVFVEEPPLPMPFELARTLLVRGQLERRLKQKRAARQSLEQALALFKDVGAALWQERTEAELARLGRAADPAGLTASELRVAELAAAGLSNREIAATAFMSQKTVEANLSRIYRKLGIRSRAELGVRLATQARPPVSPPAALVRESAG